MPKVGVVIMSGFEIYFSGIPRTAMRFYSAVLIRPLYSGYLHPAARISLPAVHAFRR